MGLRGRQFVEREFSLDRMCARVTALYDSLVGQVDESRADHGALPPPSGGVATHCRELVRALDGAGVRANLIDPRRVGPDGRDGRPRLLARLALARLRASSCTCTPTGTTAAAGSSPRCAPPAISARRCSRCTRAWRPPTSAATRAPAASSPRATRASSPSTPRSPPRSSPSASPAARIIVRPRSRRRRSLPPVSARPGAIRRAHPLLIAGALAPGPEYGADRAPRRLPPGARAPPRRRPPPLRPRHALAGARRRRPRPRRRRSVYHLGELPRSARSPWSPPPICSSAPRSPTATPSACAKRWRSAARWSPPPSVRARQRQRFSPPAKRPRARNRSSNRSPSVCLRTRHRVDCLPTLLDLYARVGAQVRAVATGTALATGP